MAIIDLRGAGADFARALAGIGQGADTLIRNWRYDPAQAMFEEAVRDPNIGRPLAAAYRDSQTLNEFSATSEGDPQAHPIGERLARMGWTPQMLEELSRVYTPTVEEVSQRETLRRGLIQSKARLEETELESKQRYQDAANRHGLPELTAQAELVGTVLQTSLNEQQLDALAHYEKFIQDNNFEGIASVGQLNPTFLNYLLAHEQMDLNAQLAALRGVNDQQEMAIRMARLKMDFDEHANKLVNQLRTAIENKERSLIPPLIDRMNDLAQHQFDLFPGDAATWATGVARMFGNQLKDVDFSSLTRPEFIIERGAQILASGEGTLDDLMKAEGYTDDMRDAILSRAQQLGHEGEGSIDVATQASALANIFSWEGLETEIAKRQSMLEEGRLTQPGHRAAVEFEIRALRAAKRIQQGIKEFADEAVKYGPGGQVDRGGSF